MTYTLATTIEGFVDCTVAQIVATVLSVSPRTPYSDAEVVQYARSAIHWTDLFGFRTAGPVGQSMKETNYLRYTGQVPFGSHNFGGIAATNDGAPGARFATIDDGWRAMCCHWALYVWGPPEQWPAHLQQYAPYAIRLAAMRDAHLKHRDEQGQPYAMLGAVTTWGDMRNGRWAWTKTIPYGSLANGYASGSIAIANNVLSRPRGEEPPMARPIIALAAGHHNTNRGGAVGEYERVGPLTREIARQARANGGFDVRVITPNDGMGDFVGGLQDVAREAVRLNADFFLEVHFEGVSNAAVRGCFAIYPDWPPDTDIDVRDVFGVNVTQRIKVAPGIPLRGNGTMSEKSTGVGSQGFRLGAFSASESARATMTRTIIEYGTLTNAADRAIIDGPQFNERAAAATVAALLDFYGLAEQPGGGGGGGAPVEDTLTLNGIPIVRGFRAHYLRIGAAVYPADPVIGGIAVFGYPLAAEYKTVAGSAQRFERMTLQWFRDNPPPFDIIGVHRGAEDPEPVAA